jgi:FkbM family methyltransferase
MEVKEPPKPAHRPESGPKTEPWIARDPPPPRSLEDNLASEQIDLHALAVGLPHKARIAYCGEAAIQDHLQAIGAANIRHFRVGPTAAYGYTRHGHAWLAFRGSRTDGLLHAFVDFCLIDFCMLPWSWPLQHHGFLCSWRNIEPDIVAWIDALPADCRRLILTGHSLGGALAILAGFHLSPMFPVRAVITFGAPRVGLLRFYRRYCERPADPAKAAPSLDAVTRRYTHATDVVSRVPPPILLYCHVGKEYTVDDDGRIEEGAPQNLYQRFERWWDALFKPKRPVDRAFAVSGQSFSETPAAQQTPEAVVANASRALQESWPRWSWVLFARPSATELWRILIVVVSWAGLVKAADARHHSCDKYVNAFARHANNRQAASPRHMIALPPLSYAQRFEDFHLWRCFGGKTGGFYIDIGAGPPVYDNVSFAFYLAGWRGIAVEPNPTLAALNRAVRPGDHLYEGLCGAAAGEATLYLQREFHGLSTTIAEHAQAAEKEVGRSAEAIARPVTTLAALCRQHAPPEIDFLKIDVEGAEADVLRGADFARFRPKVIVVEAIKPFTLEPAWDEWEPLLSRHGYSYVWDDELNRYYVAAEARALADRLAEGPKWYAGGPQIGNFGKADDDPNHPDHRLALLLRGLDMARLPLTDHAVLLAKLTADIPDRPAFGFDRATISALLSGPSPAWYDAPRAGAFLAWPPGNRISATSGETVHALYAEMIESDAFRAACGRIAASYSW